MKLRDSVRTALVTSPRIHSLKSELYQWGCRVIGHPHDPDFWALRQLLAPGAVCLDLGANRGQSIDAIRMMVPRAQILAFEPQQAMYLRLMERYPSLEVYCWGAGEVNEELTLCVPWYNGCRFDGAATLLPEDALTWLSYSINDFDPTRAYVEEATVKIVRLDDCDLPRVDFVKVDIQGFELPALRGAEGMLRRDQPILMVETPDEDLVSYLAALGYQMYVWDKGKLTAADGTWSLNKLFVAGNLVRPGDEPSQPTSSRGELAS